MALPATTVCEVRTAGNDTNGGGFDSTGTGTDYSLQNSKNTVGSNISTTDAVAAGTTTITSATASFTSAINGNIIYLQGGTGSLTAGWYRATFVSSTAITVDRTVATGTGITLNIGGAFLTIQVAVALASSGSIVFVQNVGAEGSSVYGISSGIFVGQNTIIHGYTSSRSVGNTDARPAIQTQANTITQFSGSGAALLAMNLVLDGNNGGGFTNSKPYASGAFVRCHFKNFNLVPTVGSGASFLYCSSTANSVTVFLATAAFCVADANTASGFFVTHANGCIASNNSGASSGGIFASAQAGNILNCVAYNNGNHGFSETGSFCSNVFVNCHAENNGQTSGTGYGFNISNSNKGLQNCSAYNNKTGTVTSTGSFYSLGFITVTAGSVFTNAAGGDFSLNNTANQGALLRAASFPTSFPFGLTANYRDIGAAQHQDAGGTTINIYPIFD